MTDLMQLLTAVTLLAALVVAYMVFDKFHTRINKRSTKRKNP